MKQMLTIIRRELTAYFISPIGYIYLLTFTLFTNVLALYTIRGKNFFEYPVADMREYFHVLAGVSAFLVAAVTMRLWSEERKENTYEMLLTFPMRARDLVLGKFLASLAFFVVALVGTLTIPLMMIWLSQSSADAIVHTGFWGQLDIGSTLSGYFGALLLGGLFIAFGLFISSLCRDQIVAFVLTAPILFFSYILGINKIKADLDKALGFLGRIFPFLGEEVGATIGNFVGIFVHFDNLARGLVTGSDVLFFVVWIVIFLLLNGLAIERRNRPNCNLMFAASAVLLVSIGALVNVQLLGKSFGRMDVTEGQIFTVDEVSIEVLRRLEDTVTVRYIVTPRHRLPAELQDLERDVTDKIEALKRASGGKLKYEIFYQEAVQELAEEKKAEKEENQIEKRLLKEIQPFSIEVREEDSVTAKLIYSGLTISYGTEDTEAITPLTMREVSQLEYRLTRFIHRMTRDKAPVVALVAPMESMPPYMMNMYRQMGRPVPPPDDPYQYLPHFLQQENYQVQRVKLTEQEPLPADYDVLAIVGVKELNPRQQWEINRALVNGKHVILAVQKHVFKYQSTRGGISVTHTPQTVNIDRVLGASQLTVGDEVLMDVNSKALEMRVPTPLGIALPQLFPAGLRMHAHLAGDSLNSAHPSLQSVGQMRYIWGTTLKVDEKKLKEAGLKITPLLNSGPKCWTRALAGAQLKPEDIEAPVRQSDYGRRLLAALVEGQFKNAFEGEEAPDWPPEQPGGMPPRRPPPVPSDTTISPQPGKLILIATDRLFHRDFIQWPEMNFFLNSVGFLGLDEEGQAIRRLREKTFRSHVIPDISSKNVDFWQALQILGLPVLIVGAGVAVWLLRRRRREQYGLTQVNR